MGGADTIRGIGYQQAITILDGAIALLRDPAGVNLIIEGAEDVVDFEVVGSTRRVVQVKTKVDDYQWTPSEIVKVVEQWINNDDGAATYAFISDGRLSNKARNLSVAIEYASTRDKDAAKVALRAASTLIDENTLNRIVGILPRISIDTARGTLGMVLSQAEYELLKVFEGAQSIGSIEAENAINKLFRHLFELGSERDVRRRSVDRDTLAEVVGLDLLLVGREIGWSPEVADAYRAGADWAPTRSSIPSLARTIISRSAASPMLNFVSATPRTDLILGDPEPEPLSNVFNHQVTLLGGPSGSGKSTALMQLAKAANELGKVAVVLTTSDVAQLGLRASIARAIEECVKSQISGRGRDDLWRDPNLLLLIDDVSEVDDESRLKLRSELNSFLAIRKGDGRARIILAGRDMRLLRESLTTPREASSVELSGFGLSELTAVATSISQDSYSGTSGNADNNGQLAPIDIARLVQRELAESSQIPLVATMAVSLAVMGYDLRSTAFVYRQFVNEMLERSPQPRADRLIAVGGIAGASVLQLDQRPADRWTWIKALNGASRILVEKGMTVASEDGESLLRDIVSAGLLLTYRNGPIGWVHDSIGEFLIASAIDNGMVDPPESLESRWTHTVYLLAQMRTLSFGILRGLAKGDQIGAVRVAKWDSLRELPASADKDIEELVNGLSGRSAGKRRLSVIDSNGWRSVSIGASSDDFQPSEDEPISDQLRQIHIRGVPGLLNLATEIWGADICESLLRPRLEPLPNLMLKNQIDAIAHLETHFAKIRDKFEQCLEIFPLGVRDAIILEVGPLNGEGFVGPPETVNSGGFGPRTEMSLLYRNTVGKTHFQALPRNAIVGTLHDWGGHHTTVSATLARQPHREAINLIFDALKDLTGQRWPDW